MKLNLIHHTHRDSIVCHTEFVCTNQEPQIQTCPKHSWQCEKMPPSRLKMAKMRAGARLWATTAPTNGRCIENVFPQAPTKRVLAPSTVHWAPMAHWPQWRPIWAQNGQNLAKCGCMAAPMPPDAQRITSALKMSFCQHMQSTFWHQLQFVGCRWPIVARCQPPKALKKRHLAGGARGRPPAPTNCPRGKNPPWVCWW